MLHLTLAQVRHHWGRLLASATAVVIAVTFVVVTLVGGSTAAATVRSALAAPYVPATAVVEAPTELLPADADDPYASAPSLAGAVEAVRAVDGVTDVALDTTSYAAVSVGEDGAATTAQVVPVEPPGSPLRWQQLVTGRLPERPGEVAVTDRLDVAPGGVVTVTPDPPGATSEDDVPATPAAEQLDVVGVVDTGGDPTASFAPRVFVTADQVGAWGSFVSSEQLRVAAAPGTDAAALADAVGRAATGALGVPVTAQTASDATDALVESQTGGALQLVSVLLAFAVVSVLVAGLVIANTFAVLLAQRTRELALLRCVGASRRQLRRGVLLEALVTGLAASALGTALGIGITAVGSAVVARTDAPVPVQGLSVPWWAVLTGLLLGTVVTVLAATSPARAATRVAPLAALRPLDPAPLRSRGGVLRLVGGLVLLVPGAAVLVWASLLGNLLLGLAAGVPTFLGVVLLCQRGIPAAVGLVGRLLARVGGVPGRLAARNSVRVPRRTAATATALLVGVTLVSTFVVGAASVRATTTTELEAQYPADVQVVDTGFFDGPGLPADLLPAVATTPGVTGAAAVRGALVDLGDVTEQPLLGLPADVDGVVRSTTAGAPAAGEVRVGPGYAEVNRLADGDVVTATGPSGSSDLVVRVDGRNDYPVVAAAELERLSAAPPVVEVWASVADPEGRGAGGTVDALTATASAAAPDSYVAGAVLVRQGLDEVLDVLLLVVTALLGVAVVIALVGVGNTLALSVVERRQELGLLRALGQPARDVRRTLLWEAGLVAGVASVLGVGLGIAFGLAGTSSALASTAPVVLDVPWLQVAAVVAVATLAGMVASLLPARRAASTPPVAAMAG
ncbi:FtsX-like permease family protein [Pseudokineococcus lusitanus]|uniref:Putative ABC transport system permease protein n=1 Tax=Pseudokineococcus lusitanus TaxID=763993 RepID=A0A3N1HTU1_9ACTN|nr:FtsX-like permease family protein [Pseudokineococcus lusitanus]ROP45887.1 putative ABC transport system permease protein [Pseudokineococcus lusitanus]